MDHFERTNESLCARHLSTIPDAAMSAKARTNRCMGRHDPGIIICAMLSVRPPLLRCVVGRPLRLHPARWLLGRHGSWIAVDPDREPASVTSTDGTKKPVAHPPRESNAAAFSGASSIVGACCRSRCGDGTVCRYGAGFSATLPANDKIEVNQQDEAF